MFAVFLFQSAKLDAFFDIVGACVAVGVPSVLALIAVIVTSNVLKKRLQGQPSRRGRLVGVIGSILAVVIAVVVPLIIAAALAAKHGQLDDILATVALFWIPTFVLAIPAAILAIRLAIRSRAGVR